MSRYKPEHLTIRAYNVGFGDAFLLSFYYTAKKERHVLLDFGSTKAPGHTKNLTGRLVKVAKDIQKRCGEKLTAVIASHRHADHVRGFKTKKDGKGAGNIIAACKPKVVLQPWTEDPKAERDAQAPTSYEEEKRLHVQSLLDLQKLAEKLLEEGVENKDKYLSARQIENISEINLYNKSAVYNLRTMGPNEYLYYGAKTRLNRLLPGVKITVLGPPTLRHTDTIRKQRRRDWNEYWHLQLHNAIFADSKEQPFAKSFQEKGVKEYANWLAGKLKNLRIEQLHAIVRILDKALNNTSLILLFEFGKQKLLFPGDAQIESWEYALQGPNSRRNLRLLKDLTFYKVGHHGSLNATPKTLWKNLEIESKANFTTLLSTRDGAHGSKRRGTEVPREPLVKALKRKSTLVDMREVHKDKELSVDIKFEA